MAKPLIIGFSFSLHADGSPGLYNKVLAQYLLAQDVRAQIQAGACLHLQWEIAEAMYMEDPIAFKVLEPHLQVTQPSLYGDGDVQFSDLGFLDEGSSDQIALQQCYESAPGMNALARMNHLLLDAQLFKRFPGLALHDLTRPGLGDLFTEHRALPKPEKYLEGLGVFQRIRVNRLILSAVVNDPAKLAPLPYISTKDVIDRALDLVQGRGATRIFVLAHPLHVGRCKRQLEAELTARRIADEFESVECADVKLTSWDKNSAQVWCRTEQNWQAYEQKVAELLASRT